MPPTSASGQPPSCSCSRKTPSSTMPPSRSCPHSSYCLHGVTSARWAPSTGCSVLTTSWARPVATCSWPMPRHSWLSCPPAASPPPRAIAPATSAGAVCQRCSASTAWCCSMPTVSPATRATCALPKPTWTTSSDAMPRATATSRASARRAPRIPITASLWPTLLTTPSPACS